MCLYGTVRTLATLFFWLVLLLPECSGVRNVFRTGAVLAKSGNVKEMVDARKGYELGVDVVNRLNEGKGFAVRDRTGAMNYFKLEFDSKDDESKKEKHMDLLDSILDGDKPVDFLLGSHPEFAFEETKMSNRYKRINIQCCVGPDAVYAQNLPYVFGVQVSNKQYPQLAMYRMYLQKIQRLAVISRTDNAFTNSTCEAALTIARHTEDLDHDPLLVKVVQGYEMNESTNPKIFEDFVQDCIKENVEAVIACSFLDDGKLLIDAFHAAKKSMKAFFMTVGPSNKNWVAGMGERSDFLLSAGQWHTDLRYSDDLFGTTAEYQLRYQALHGDGVTPSYVAASASAAIYTLVAGIQRAFSQCDISQTYGDLDEILFNPSKISCWVNETTGYERIRKALEGVDLDTFFGRIKFNSHRQNEGNDPATTQVFSHFDGSRHIHAVLPETAARARLVMPAQNKYKVTCKPGQSMSTDEFEDCEPCAPGEFSENENSAHCDHCPAGSWSSEEGQSECTPCPKGTTTYGPGATGIVQCYCKDGHYNSKQQNGKECRECPIGAYCSGKISLPFPLEGYWMDETWREAAYECDSENVCIGGPKLACKTGHTGRLCSECVEGYYGVISKCRKCPTKGVLVTFIVLVVLGWYVINVVVSKNVASLEMILSWAQLANVIGDVDLRWPSKLRVMFGVANVLDFDVDILEPSCLANWSFKHNAVVQLLLPFLMSLMAFFGFLFSCAAHKCKKHLSRSIIDRMDNWMSWLVTIPRTDDELHAKWDGTIAAFLSSVEVTYITVTKYSFDVFKCEDIAGVSVLRTAPSIECGTKEHRELMALGFVGTVAYSIGYLLFVSWKIYQLYMHHSFQNPRNVRRYGFLYYRFELDYCWTPIVVLGRRLLFIIVLVFVNNPGFQAGALAFIVNASLVLHTYSTPYAQTCLDAFFSFLCVALMFESFSGVLFYSTNLPSNNRVILEWIVLLVVLAMFAIAIYFLVWELKMKYQVNYIRQLHCRNILKSVSQKTVSFFSAEARDARKLVCGKVLNAFDTSFLYSAMKKNPEHIHNWNKLTEMLKEYVSDQGECSYLSREPVAKFWRKLVDRFPELLDFLAVADKGQRDHFSAFATTLYQDFYLTNKIQKLPLFSVLNWRDRAAMAQWLAMAEESDREFFISFMRDLFKSSGKADISFHDDKVPQVLVVDPADEKETVSPTIQSACAWKPKWLGRENTVSREVILAELNSGRNPLEPKRHPSFRATAMQVHTVVALRMSAAKRREQRRSGATEEMV